MIFYKILSNTTFFTVAKNKNIYVMLILAMLELQYNIIINTVVRFFCCILVEFLTEFLENKVFITFINFIMLNSYIP